MGTLSATKEDVDRWVAQGREDILRFVEVFPYGAGDLWIDEKGVERLRCPFVRKVRNQPRYLCTIYETRPQVCRDYVPWSGEANDLCEVV